MPDVVSAYLGTTELKKAYLGDILLFDLTEPPGGYRYVRWTITELRSAGAVQVAEFELLTGGSAVNLSGASISNPGGEVLPGEEIGNLIDGDLNTKWFDGNFGFNGNISIVILDAGLGNTFIFDAYRWATANNLEERDPVSWTLEVSHDAVDWTLIDTQVSQAITTDRFTYTDAYDASGAASILLIGSGTDALLIGGTDRLVI